MNVSFQWLNAIAPGLGKDPQEVERVLALRGAPIEGVEDPGEALKDVVIGKVLEAHQHPNADRLSVCRVLGPDGEVQVICGAPNVEAGAYYPFAPVGAVLPGDFKIGQRKIRGELSQGMLCSERELGLGTEHDGILRLDGTPEPGSSFVDFMGLNDVCLDVEVTPNRGDLLSHVGIARELHPQGHGGIQLPAIQGAPDVALSWIEGETEAANESVRIAIKEPDLCYNFLAVVIRGVKVGPSPAWLQSRLRSVGARPISNVVDATNYVLHELGHPTHAYDLAKVRGAEIVVRNARDGEKLVTLDGVDQPITPSMLQICDGEGPVGIGGVMGGLDSEVTDDTVDVLLECAVFHPAHVRATRRALGISTDASYRFERGVDPAGRRDAFKRVVEIILATAGGEIDGPAIDVCPRPWNGLTVELRPSRVEHLLGVAFSVDQIVELLTPLGYTVQQAGDDLLKVDVPGFRSYDTVREVDLIEEVARTYGYDAFPDHLTQFRPGTVPDHPLFQLEDDLRTLLAGRGLSEAQTSSLGPDNHGDVALLNPMTGSESHLRRDRLGGLLRHVERNHARGVRDVRLFELGTGFADRGEGTRPKETSRVAAVLTGRREPLHWQADDAPFGAADARGLLEAIGRRVFPNPEVRLGEAPFPWLSNEGHWVLINDGVIVGAAGLVDPNALDVPPWAGEVLGLEVTLPDDPHPAQVPIAPPLPSQPASSRDVAFLVPRATPAENVLEAIRGTGVRVLEDVRLFDVYEGDDLPDAVRSIAFRLRFRAADRTLTEAEVDKAFARILSNVKEVTGVQPRG